MLFSEQGFTPQKKKKINERKQKIKKKSPVIVSY